MPDHANGNLIQRYLVRIDTRKSHIELDRYLAFHQQARLDIVSLTVDVHQCDRAKDFGYLQLSHRIAGSRVIGILEVNC